MTSVETLVKPALPATLLRSLVRDSFVYAGVLVLAPLWLPAWAERRWRLGEGWFAGCSELLSLAPGKLGIFLRRTFYVMTLDYCATDAHIGFGTTISHPDAEIHPKVYVGLRCTVGRVVLEPDATIGSNVDIPSGRRQHDFARLDAPIQSQGGQYARLRVGRNSWVGNGSVIMADVGPDCVIGAGSVVVRPIPARSVAVGNPAVVKKTRAA